MLADCNVRVKTLTPTILGWPTESFSIDLCSSATEKPVSPHTILVFIPGNPGLMEWYIPMFQALVQRLGAGFCARGAANAGHSLDSKHVNIASAADSPHQSKDIPWTVDGQSLHKAAYVDSILEEFSEVTKPDLVFVAHSIGTHFTYRMLLCRPDIMAQTKLVLALTPFIRMKAPWCNQAFLDFGASRPETIIKFHEGLSQGAACLPFWLIKILMKKVTDPHGREIAAQLVRQPNFMRNFFLLGLEEIRDVPETVDVSIFHYLTCKTAMLFAGNDQWAPEFHAADLKTLQQKSLIPENVTITHRPELLHDFVSHPKQVPVVVEFCLENIRRCLDGHRRSRL